jgi:hypothetical protein
MHKEYIRKANHCQVFVADFADFEQRCPFGEANATMYCPSCGSVATHIYTTSNLQRMYPVIKAALQREEKCRYEPEVVRHPAPAPSSQWQRSHWMAGH